MNSKSTPSNTGRPSIKGRVVAIFVFAFALVIGTASPLLSPSGSDQPIATQAAASVVIEVDSRTDVALSSDDAPRLTQHVKLVVNEAPAVRKDKAVKSKGKKKFKKDKKIRKKRNAPAKGTVWDRLAHCESTSNWSIASGNGYYGGLQFSMRTWKAFGGKGMPNKASRKAQIAVAERVLEAQGWKAWPACSRKLGLR